MLNANDVLEYKVIDGENPCDDCGQFRGVRLIKAREYCLQCAFDLACRFLRETA